MLPVGRKPVVQYVVEELARCGIGRLLFVTGPGKTAIENHFDIDAELIASLRETGKEELLEELAFEREDIQYFYTRQRRQLGLGHAVLCAAGGGPAVFRRGPGRLDHRPASAIAGGEDHDRGVRTAAGRRGGGAGGGAAGRGGPLRHRPAAGCRRAGLRVGRPRGEAVDGRGAEQSGRGRALRIQPGDLRLPGTDAAGQRRTKSNSPTPSA